MGTEPCERCGEWTYIGAQPCLRCWPAIIVNMDGTTTIKREP